MYYCRFQGCPFKTRGILSLKAHLAKCPCRNRVAQSAAVDNNASKPPPKRLKSIPSAPGCPPPSLSSQTSSSSPPIHSPPSVPTTTAPHQQSGQSPDVALPSVLPLLAGIHHGTHSGNASSPPSDAALEEMHMDLVVVFLATMASDYGHQTVDELISLFKSPQFSFKRFSSTITSARRCTELQRSIFERYFSENGFKRKTISSPERKFSGTLYAKDPIQVLKQQLRLSNVHNTFFQPISQNRQSPPGAFSHPMSARLAKDITFRLKQNVISSANAASIWFDMKTHGTESFVGLLQLYSDKSSTSLKQTSITSYPLHVTFLNFSNSLRQHCISQGHTILAYLPVDIQEAVSDTELDPMPALRGSALREAKMSIVHQAIQLILSPIIEMAEKGFSFQAEDGLKRVCHSVPVSFCADIPEAKDILSILHGTITARPCHRCLVPKDHLNCLPSIPPPARSSSHTKNIRQTHSKLLQKSEEDALCGRPKQSRDRKSQADALLRSNSLSPFPFIFEESSVFNLTPELTPYNIFVFKPLHNLHLGVSKLIKTAAVEHLQSE